MAQPQLPFARYSDTSRAAAGSMKSSAQTIRARILELIQGNGDLGSTCDEIECYLELTHQTASARVWELKGNPAGQEARIRDSGARRATRSGRKATVWVAIHRSHNTIGNNPVTKRKD